MSSPAACQSSIFRLCVPVLPCFPPRQAKLGAEFLWGLVSRDWAGVVLDCLRLVA